MRYTENFKKQVVQKALERGLMITEIGSRLSINPGVIHKWISLYKNEVQARVVEVDIRPLLEQSEVDVEELLRRAEYQELKQTSGSESLAQQIDQIKRTRKDVRQYTDADKYAVVMSLRAIPTEQQGLWLRQLGLQSPHIKLWEEQLITMSKKTITTDEYTKRLEDENQKLKKALVESERDNRELKILIELKKKYPTLFHQDEEKS